MKSTSSSNVCSKWNQINVSSNWSCSTSRNATNLTLRLTTHQMTSPSPTILHCISDEHHCSHCSDDVAFLEGRLHARQAYMHCHSVNLTYLLCALAKYAVSILHSLQARIFLKLGSRRIAGLLLVWFANKREVCLLNCGLKFIVVGSEVYVVVVKECFHWLAWL